MLSNVDKILSAHGLLGRRPVVLLEEDPASEIVLAAEDALREALIALADADDDGDDDDDKGKDTDNDSDHLEHATYKAMKKRGMPDKAAAAICAKADAKKVKASAAVAGALVALGGLSVNRAQSDWVERTAFDPKAVGLAADPDKPYGDVDYADPGYQGDGKKRYPIDQSHIHAAIGYFSKAKNRAVYSADQIKSIWGRIKSAAKKFGVEMSPDTGAVAASMVLLTQVCEDSGYLSLAWPAPSMGKDGMHHGPMSGQHAHPHMVPATHEHPHFHNNDAMHEHPHG